MKVSYVIDVCLYVTKCIGTKLQMLLSRGIFMPKGISAQKYLLTIEIDPPSDVKKSAILAPGRHLEFLNTNI
jgi:hypothetical protein